MSGRKGGLRIGQHLLVELFARTQARVFYPDVLADFKSVQLYHLFRQVRDFHRFAHVEDTDFIARRNGRRLHYQAAGFGYSHEEPCDLGMGHRDRSSALDLLAETGYHASVRTQHVPEPGGDELRHSFDLPGGNGKPQRLNVDLRYTLGAAHDVSRVHRLVRGYHHHLLHAVLDALVGNVA